MPAADPPSVAPHRAVPVPAPVPEPGTLPVPDRLQVWWAQVDVGHLSEQVRADLTADLDAAAIAKVGRFVRAQDRDRGLAAHSLLRRLLAAVVGGRPAELVLRTRCAVCGTSEHGKPYLDLAGQRSPVELNLSHSGPVVAVALAPAGTAVGVDVEAHRAIDWTNLRRAVFADPEWVRTEAAADPDHSRFDAWARKESSVKASGHGLSIPLREVLVSEVMVSEVMVSCWTATLPDGRGSTAGWDLPLLSDVAAAVATHASGVLARPEMPEPPAVHLVTIG